MTDKKIFMAADHGGLVLKDMLRDYLDSQNIVSVDLGTYQPDSVDYPDYAAKLAQALKEEPDAFGILVCGTGIGISIAANRFSHIRAALTHDALGARLSRQHNNANVIIFGGRVIGPELAVDCLRVFLETDFEGGRHARRVQKLADLAKEGQGDNK